MNILVIGNGFDLAHELPTKYTDFLKWVKELQKIGDRLKWVDEIPFDEKEADKWLNDCTIPEEWIIKFDDELILHFLDSDLQSRKMLALKNSHIREWLMEHNIELPKIRDTIMTAEYYDEILRALDIDRKEKVVKKKNSIDSILELINKNNNQDERCIKNFFEHLKLQYASSDSDKLNKEIYFLIKHNIWLSEFLEMQKSMNGNWIDFEKEISNVIIDYDAIINGNMEFKISNYSSNYFRKYYLNIYSDYEIKLEYTAKEFIKKLECDLKKLIRAFEIYLCEYVEKLEIKKKSPDIDALDIDHILSFNYTHTFTYVYEKEKKSDFIDYIHGEANIENSINTNNMIIGIDEYLSADRKNKDVEFIAFKKYYQRIYKGTGSKYKDWIDTIWKENNIYMERKHDCEIYLENIDVLSNIKEERKAELKQLNDNPPRHNLYIFGHSLDITDKDVLRDLILNDNVYTTIFYHDKDTMGQQIANLVKVIGQDELIRRTGGSTKTIEFVPQKPMVPIDNQESN